MVELSMLSVLSIIVVHCISLFLHTSRSVSHSFTHSYCKVLVMRGLARSNMPFQYTQACLKNVCLTFGAE